MISCFTVKVCLRGERNQAADLKELHSLPAAKAAVHKIRDQCSLRVNLSFPPTLLQISIFVSFGFMSRNGHSFITDSCFFAIISVITGAKNDGYAGA